MTHTPLPPPSPDCNAGVPCHAGAGHGPAADRGPSGVLCDPCWQSVQRIVKRNLPSTPRRTP